MSDETSKDPSLTEDVFKLIGEPIVGKTAVGETINQTFYHVISSEADRLSRTKPEDIQEIAASQIKLLAGYYDLVLGQARRSFRWALTAAGIGLLFFLASVGFLLLQRPQSLAAISLISGALIEIISAINFYLYGKTSAQLAMFHTRLDTTQRFLLANSMCESLDGDFKQKARYELIQTVARVEAANISEHLQTGEHEHPSGVAERIVGRKPR